MGVKVFIVISVKESFYKKTKAIVLEYVESLTVRKCIVVEEYGKKGNHPHLNLVYTSNCKNHVSLYKQWKGILGEEITKANPRCIKVKRVYDLDTLINGYLKKEAGAVILLSKGVRCETPAEAECRKLEREYMKKYGTAGTLLTSSLGQLGDFVDILYHRSLL